jgi:hypothetical protein
MFLTIQPLLAVDLTHIAITLVVLFFAVMKQLFDSSKESSKKKTVANAGPRPQQPQPQLQPGPPRPVQGGDQADPLRSQVEEFLRRASKPPEKESSRQQPQPQRRPPSEIELLVEGENRLRTSPAAAAAKAAVAADKKRATRRPSKRQTVAEHVEEQVAARSQSIAQKASNLGQRIVTEDQQFDNQLKAKFEHKLGALSVTAAPLTSAEQQAAAPATPAARVAAMLANPDGVWQAVVINEILSRPSDRW